MENTTTTKIHRQLSRTYRSRRLQSTDQNSYIHALTFRRVHQVDPRQRIQLKITRLWVRLHCHDQTQVLITFGLPLKTQIVRYRVYVRLLPTSPLEQF